MEKLLELWHTALGKVIACLLAVALAFMGWNIAMIMGAFGTDDAQQTQEQDADAGNSVESKAVVPSDSGDAQGEESSASKGDAQDSQDTDNGDKDGDAASNAADTSKQGENSDSQDADTGSEGAVSNDDGADQGSNAASKVNAVNNSQAKSNGVWDWWKDRQEKTDTITFNPTVENATVKMFVYKSGKWSDEGTVASGSFDVDVKKSDGKTVFLFFVKGDGEHLVTHFNADGAGNIYSVKNHRWGQLGDISSVCNTAAEDNYVGYFGYTREVSKDTKESISFTVSGQTPSLGVSVKIGDGATKLAPGDVTDAVVTITPAKELEGRTLFASELKLDSLTIGGKAVDISTLHIVGQTDGTYTAVVPNYVVTADDCVSKSLEVKATASITYSYSFTAGKGDKADIETSVRVASSAASSTPLAVKAGVSYAYKYTGASFEPSASADIPVLPTGGEVYGGYKVATGPAAGTVVDDEANGGKWTFQGWKINGAGDVANGTQQAVNSDESVVIVGTWAFSEYPTYTIKHCWVGDQDHPFVTETGKVKAGTTINASDQSADIRYTVKPDQTTSLTVSESDSNTLTILYYKNVTLIANSAQVTYNGTAQSVSGYTIDTADATDVQGITFTSKVLSILSAGDAIEVGASGTDAGIYPAGFASDVVRMVDDSGCYFVATTIDGKLTINPAPLAVTTGSASKSYDEEPLTCSTIEVTGWVNNESAPYSATGSQTTVGSSPNTYAIDWTAAGSTAKQGNYSISKDAEHLGTLTVTDEVTHKLTVNYVYADGTQAHEPYTQALRAGKTYSVPSPTIDGYTADKLTVSGTMGDKDVEFTVIYNVNKYTLTIHYVYADGSKAAEDHSESLAKGDTYNVDSPVIDSYTADKATVSGIVDNENVTVEVTYTKNAPVVVNHTLTIHYVYTDDSKAADDYSASLAKGDAYSVDSPAIEGYAPDQDTVSGTMDDDNVTVKVVYTKNAPVINKHTLTVLYVFENGSTAASSYVETYAEGAEYNVLSPVIVGYTADTDAVKGAMGASDIEVTVIYKANSTPIVPDPDPDPTPAPDPSPDPTPAPDPDPTPAPDPDPAPDPVDPVDPDDPVTPDDPDDSDTPDNPDTPDDPDTPDTPDNPVTPNNNNGGNSNSGGNGNGGATVVIPGGTNNPIYPVIDAITPSVVIEDDGNALDGGDTDSDDGNVTIVDEDGNPLMTVDSCWIHFYMAIGMILTVLYGLGVFGRRRAYAGSVNKLVDDVLNKGNER